MTKARGRLYIVLLVVVSLAVALTLAAYALKDNISYFRAPADVKRLQDEQSPAVAAGVVFRLGGMVKEGSLEKRGDDLSIAFVVTDYKEDVIVTYKGLLPALFREGQGVVAKGALNQEGVFVAQSILAKHDENYMPPEVKKALESNAE